MHSARSYQHNLQVQRQLDEAVQTDEVTKRIQDRLVKERARLEAELESKIADERSSQLLRKRREQEQRLQQQVRSCWDGAGRPIAHPNAILRMCYRPQSPIWYHKTLGTPTTLLHAAPHSLRSALGSDALKGMHHYLFASAAISMLLRYGRCLPVAAGTRLLCKVA